MLQVDKLDLIDRCNDCLLLCNIFPNLEEGCHLKITDQAEKC